MKRQPYTLIEILVVISIIGILVAITAPVLTSVKKSAMLNRASAECAAIQLAIKNYETEYLTWPRSTASYAYGNYPSDIKNSVWATVEWKDFINAKKTEYNNFFTALTGIELTGTTVKDTWGATSKKIKFLDLPPNFIKNGGFIDPWGKPYCILMDGTGNDRLEFKLINTVNVLAPVAVFTREGKAGENTKRFATSWGGTVEQ